jgi:hypothetical protein
VGTDSITAARDAEAPDKGGGDVSVTAGTAGASTPRGTAKERSTAANLGAEVSRLSFQR